MPVALVPFWYEPKNSERITSSAIRMSSHSRQPVRPRRRPLDGGEPLVRVSQLRKRLSMIPPAPARLAPIAGPFAQCPAGRH
jgi:hypothetical protein